MQMLKKIFKSDKKYYLELEDSDVPQAVQQAVKTAEKVVDKVQDQAGKVADAVQDQAAALIESQPAPKAITTAQEVVKTLEKPTATKKAQGKSVKKAASQPKVATPAKNSGASSFDPPFWVAAMYKNNTNQTNSDGTKAEQTFAPDNLMPTVTKYRRTAGPSLNKFKDMARQTKNFRG